MENVISKKMKKVEKEMFSQTYEQPWKSETWNRFENHRTADDVGQGILANVGGEGLEGFEQ
jgi:hypothetical protein